MDLEYSCAVMSLIKDYILDMVGTSSRVSVSHVDEYIFMLDVLHALGFRWDPDEDIYFEPYVQSDKAHLERGEKLFFGFVVVRHTGQLYALLHGMNEDKCSAIPFSAIMQEATQDVQFRY